MRERIRILLITASDYFSFKDSFGYRKSNFFYITFLSNLIAAENFFIKTAQSLGSLKITVGTTTTTKKLHFHFSTKIYLTWMKILKRIFYSMHVCRKER